MRIEIGPFNSINLLHSKLNHWTELKDSRFKWWKEFSYLNTLFEITRSYFKD